MNKISIAKPLGDRYEKNEKKPRKNQKRNTRKDP
jgi:hypothetical protein